MTDRSTSPTDMLREEHRRILRSLGLLEVAAERLGAQRTLPVGWWEEMLGWLRSFADRNHHGKEEEHLFPALTAAGVPAEGGPIGVMLDEHTEGRALIETMSGQPVEQRVQAARRYGRLLRDHIDKENGVLLPLAEAVLGPPERERVALGFARLEVEQGPAASIDRADAALDRLAVALGD